MSISGRRLVRNRSIVQRWRSQTPDVSRHIIQHESDRDKMVSKPHISTRYHKIASNRRFMAQDESLTKTAAA